MNIGIVCACQYTVRDIGFVDLRGKEYTLIIRAHQDVRENLGDLSFIDDSNVKLLFDSLQSPAATKDGAAAIDAVVPQVVAELMGPDGRLLQLSKFESANDQTAVRIKDQLFESVLMTKIRTRSIDTFAQILLVSGNDAEQNRIAKEKVEKAMEAIKRIEPMLPRPLARPIEIISIDDELKNEERVLLWGLGIDPDSNNEPIVGVLYGRSKLAGKVLVGESIDTREVLAQLALIGESCECETDRSWNDLLVLPHYWPATLRKQTSSSLGFDPESPLVRAEVERIVSRGVNSESRGDGASGRVDQIEQLLLGYDEREVMVQATATNAPPASGSANTTDRGQPDGFNAVVESGDGWGFGENAAIVDSKDGSIAGSLQTERPESGSDNAASLDELQVEQPGDSETYSTADQHSDENSESSGLSLLVYVLGAMAGVFLSIAVFIVWLMRA